MRTFTRIYGINALCSPRVCVHSAFWTNAPPAPSRASFHSVSMAIKGNEKQWNIFFSDRVKLWQHGTVPFLAVCPSLCQNPHYMVSGRKYAPSVQLCRFWSGLSAGVAASNLGRHQSDADCVWLLLEKKMLRGFQKNFWLSCAACSRWEVWEVSN